MLEQSKISLIHVAKSKLNLSEISYRDILASFDVKTSKALNDAQFHQLMKVFKDLGFESDTPKVRGDLNKMTSENGVKLASNAQIGMIRGMWQDKARFKEDESLEWFVYRITKKISLNVLTHRDIVKLKEAIENLGGVR